MRIKKEFFGVTPEGIESSKFYLENSRGNYAVVSDYGCTILEIWIADRKGQKRNVVLGYNTLEEYLQNDEYLGACVGRFGGWIKAGEIHVNDRSYQLSIREGEKHHLHGGDRGFDKFVWDSQIEENQVVFSRVSQDGEEHYPGNLDVKIRYAFTEEDELKITYEAVCDRDTICNLTNHSYFNLEGENAGCIYGHQLQMEAEKVQSVNADGISEGGLFSVERTPFDFRQRKTIGRDAEQPHIQLQYGGGYDHNYYLGKAGEWKRAAILYSEKSGIEMKVLTTQSGVQLYTSNSMDGSILGRSGTFYHPYDAVCFETQYCASEEQLKAGERYPVLKKGELYKYETIYQFATAH